MREEKPKFAKKSLGQNFLVDKVAIQKIVDAVPSEIPLLLEIGPGRGALSLGLAKKAAKYCVLEKDDVFAKEIGETIRIQGQEEVFVFHTDALDFDWEKLWTETGVAANTQLVVCANLPYNVATEILFRLLERQDRISKMVLMFQKEVGQRIAARPNSKAYGNISVAAQNFYNVSMQQTLKPTAFRPSPKVESAVLVFERREKPVLPFKDREHFLRFHQLVRVCFSHRRKTLENSLSMELGRTEWGKFAEKKVLQEILARAKIDGQRRAETLSIEEFGAIFAELQ